MDMKTRISVFFWLLFLLFPSFLESRCVNLNLENRELYNELFGASTKPKYDIFNLVLTGHEKLVNSKMVENTNILSIIDMSMASTERRFWTIDIKEKQIIAFSLVAHGKNSGENMARNFSNKNGSLQTSLGFYKTGATYIGKHGYSLYLDGL